MPQADGSYQLIFDREHGLEHIVKWYEDLGARIRSELERETIIASPSPSPEEVSQVTPAAPTGALTGLEAQLARMQAAASVPSGAFVPKTPPATPPVETEKQTEEGKNQ